MYIKKAAFKGSFFYICLKIIISSRYQNHCGQDIMLSLLTL